MPVTGVSDDRVLVIVIAHQFWPVNIESHHNHKNESIKYMPRTRTVFSFLNFKANQYSKQAAFRTQGGLIKIGCFDIFHNP
jgi:hypothetical protein